MHTVKPTPTTLYLSYLARSPNYTLAVTATESSRIINHSSIQKFPIQKMDTEHRAQN